MLKNPNYFTYQMKFYMYNQLSIKKYIYTTFIPQERIGFLNSYFIEWVGLCRPIINLSFQRVSNFNHVRVRKPVTEITFTMYPNEHRLFVLKSLSKQIRKSKHLSTIFKQNNLSNAITCNGTASLSEWMHYTIPPPPALNKKCKKGNNLTFFFYLFNCLRPNLTLSQIITPDHYFFYSLKT